MDYATQYLGKNVEVAIDRPLGSYHPKYKYIYPINYGYLKNTKAPDNEEIDAYVLGVLKPLKVFKGKCIAVIRRINDDDDKLIVAPKGKDFNDEEIINLTDFQEKHFKSKIIR